MIGTTNIRNALLAVSLVLSVGSSRAMAATANAQSLSVAISSSSDWAQLNGSGTSFTLVAGPQHGSISIWNSSFVYVSWVGAITTSYPCVEYTPTPLYTGPDSFVWNATDGGGTSTNATCSITITTNHAPMANNQSVPPIVQGAVRSAIILTFTHADTNQAVTFTLVTAPTNGVLEYNNGSYQTITAGIPANLYNCWYYTPAAGYCGTDSFVWKMSDGIATSGNATCSIILQTNMMPIVNDATMTCECGSSYNPCALSYTHGDSGQPLSWTLVTAPTNGTMYYANAGYAQLLVGTPVNNSSWFYTPGPSCSGQPDRLAWMMSDGVGTSQTASIWITINTNKPPAIVTPCQALTCLQNTTNSLLGFLAYTHLDLKQTLTFRLSSAPAHGAVLGSDRSTLGTDVNVADNLWSYAPAAAFTGADSFVWVVSDGFAEATGRVAFTVAAPSGTHMQPVFKAGVHLQEAGQPLQVYKTVDPTSGLYLWGNPAGPGIAVAAPDVVDWNNDGLPDLVVGQADGRVALFLNKGTKGNPVFDGRTYLKEQNGTYIWGHLWCNCGGGGPACTAPRVVDWDGDGKKDLLLGQWGEYLSQPMFVCFNTGTDAAPVFSPRQVCLLGGPALPYTMPFIADWNGDGIQDLIAGDNSIWGPYNNYLGYPGQQAPNGNINVWLGSSNNHGPAPGAVLTGTQLIPQYSAANSFVSVVPSVTVTGACPAQSRKSVVVADWLGNGKKDLIIGMQDGKIWYSPNVGTPNFPVFTNCYRVSAGGSPIIVGDPAKAGQDPAWSGGGNSMLAAQNLPAVNEARIAVADLDGDGLLDLIVGDVNGDVTLYSQYNPNPVAIDGRVRAIQNVATAITLLSRVDSGHAVTNTVQTFPTHGTLSGTNANWIYTPTNTGFIGTDSFTFVVADGALVSHTGTVTISVNNAPPVAQDQMGPAPLIVIANTARAITLIASDPGNAPLTYGVVNQPVHGTVSIATNIATYTPTAGYTGTDSFSFKANDGVLDSAPATILLDVVALAINFQPTAAPIPAGYLKDDGAVFDAVRGYGWDASLTNRTLVRSMHPDARLDSFVYAITVTTWRCNLPNGNYYVTVSCGDPVAAGGIHQISVQDGAPLSKQEGWGNPWGTIPGGCPVDMYVLFANIPAMVTNGQLTVAIGNGANATCINYLEIRSGPQTIGTATFLGVDAKTQGSWIGAYGADGAWTVNSELYAPDNQPFFLPMFGRNIPAYAWLLDPPTQNKRVNVWAETTADPRALQHSWDSGRSAINFNSDSSYTLPLTFLDGATHRVALYCLDWMTNTPSQTISILDSGDNVLDSQTLTAFTGGKYMVWNLSGRVKIRMPANALLSAVFFGGSGIGAGAPAITVQPGNQTVTAGQAATFCVTATGTAPLSYQWYKGSTNVAGATNAIYTTPTTVMGDSGALFCVVVSNAAGSATSTNAMLTVNPVPVAPAITSQPTNQTVNAGQCATFNVTATGTAPLSYQWRKDGAMIGGATNANYTTPATGMGDTGALFVVTVSNVAGSVTSSNATLTVIPAVAPTIVTQPASQTAGAGQSAVFSVTAAGSAPLSYQWCKGGNTIAGATNAILTTPATVMGDNGLLFRVSVSNIAGSVESTNAMLTVASAGLTDGGWARRAKITFTGYSRAETLDNFPVLVALGTNTINGFSYADLGTANGADLRFAAADGVTELNYEVDAWSTTGVSYVWVQVPALASSNDCIWAYWGNSLQLTAPACTTNGAAWSNGYVGVWHMRESTGILTNSATGGATNNGTAVGTRPACTNCLIGNGQYNASQGTGDGNGFNVGNFPIFGGKSNITIETIFKATGDNSLIYEKMVCSRNETAGQYNYTLGKNDNAYTRMCVATNGGAEGVENIAPYSVNDWHYLAGVYNGITNARVTMDGSSYYDSNIPAGLIIHDTSTPAYRTYLFVRYTMPSQNFVGYLDEVRLSTVSRSTNWLWATWRNAMSNALFQTYGAALPVDAATAPTNTLRILSSAPEAGGLGMEFMTVSGTPYEVDWTTNLLDDDWQLYTNLIGSGENAHMIFTNEWSQAFFRILRNP